MEITDVKIRRVFPEGKLKAIVSVTFDDSFVVHDIKIIEGQNGQFVAMPNRKTVRGEYKDICHPIKKEIRDYLEDKVLTVFNDWEESNEEIIDEELPDLNSETFIELDEDNFN